MSRFPRQPWFLVCSLLVIHAGLLAYGAVAHSPAIDEVGHFPAGLGVWQQRRFDLYCVNPPLVRAVATLPVYLAADLDIPWTPPDMHPVGRPEFAIGRKLIEANAPEVFWWFTIARWACIPFSLLAGWVCFHWARSLYGTAAGFIALLLWCFDPMVLGNAQMITPDTGAAAFGVLAAYLFWKWLREPTWSDAFLAGVLLGLAELCKTSWLIFFPLWPVLWLMTRGSRTTTDATDNTDRENAAAISFPKDHSSKRLFVRAIRGIRGRCLFAEFSQLAFLLALAVYVLNLVYAFDGTFTRLGDFEFTSGTLKGDTKDYIANRFKDTWAGDLPVPLPKYYVIGIDIQKRDFEGQFRSYLRGEWQRGGWWYYYLYGLAVKLPVGTLILIGAGVILPIFTKRLAAPWRDELILLAPAAILLIFVSSQTGFNHHVRYVLPTFPFLFIFCGRVVRLVFPSTLAKSGVG